MTLEEEKRGSAQQAFNMTIKGALLEGALALKLLPNPHMEARALMSHVLGITHAEIIISEDSRLSQGEKSEYFRAISRRAKREPYAYITKTKEFLGISFEVNKGVLIPRPDTETLAEALISDLRPCAQCDLLELGVGSGCLAISLLKSLPHINITAVDISKAAVSLAKKNAKLHSVYKRLTLIKGNWYQSVSGKFAVIFSNPPYINRAAKLEPEIYHEPKLALFADRKGLASYYHIAEGIRSFLQPYGFLYLEIPKARTKAIEKIFADKQMKLLQSYKDLSGAVRCLKFGYN